MGFRIAEKMYKSLFVNIFVIMWVTWRKQSWESNQIGKREKLQRTMYLNFALVRGGGEGGARCRCAYWPQGRNVVSHRTENTSEGFVLSFPTLKIGNRIHYYMHGKIEKYKIVACSYMILLISWTTLLLTKRTLT